MAHVVEFEVEGLAGRTGVLRHKLNRDVNVFFGPNGSGKTSLLRILHSAFADDASLLRRTPFRRAVVKIYSVDLDTVLVRTLERKETDEAGAIAHLDEASPLQPPGPPLVQSEGATSWETLYEKDPGRQIKSWSHVYLPTSRLYSGIPWRSTAWFEHSVKFREEPLEEEALDDMFASLLQERWKAYAALVLRDVQAAQAQGLARILQAFLAPARSSPGSKTPGTHLDLSSAYERMGAFLSRQGSREHLGTLKEFTRRYESDPRLRQVVDDINQVEQTIAESTAPRARLQELITQIFSGPKNVTFTDTSISVTIPGNAQIGLPNLSSGEKHLLRILIEVMLAGVNTILIDEPEISMHVDWQTRFVEVVRSVNTSCQLVLATHSPEVTSLLPDEKLFRL